MVRQFYIFAVSLLLLFSCNNDVSNINLSEEARWQQHATATEIIRDSFGVPHIYGETDADAVFGLLYAQCEDDFNRVERNYIWATGRLAEVEGEGALYSDLRAQLYMTKAEAVEYFDTSPAWLKKLCVAFADGINFYLHNHPEVTPRLITHFEPWMAMYFSEGSIGGDIEGISTRKIQAFYDDLSTRNLDKIDEGLMRLTKDEDQGSNGFAISGSKTASGNAMLLINPHTSFFFRGEVHMVSNEGLNAYGAVTWGQFFVYQGFNEKTGWMHTSTGSDIKDEFEETIRKNDDGLVYKYGETYRPVDSMEVVLKYVDEGSVKERTFPIYRTLHGPITHANDDKWVATAIMWSPAKALEQSFTRTKNATHKEFKEMMNIRTNSSNNTVYADADGNIAYYHGNFIPKRDTSFDYTKPVDGSNPKTAWNGLHTVDENIFVHNPDNGWIQNCNSTPYTSAGVNSPKREDYPYYMTSFKENYRGVHAIRLLAEANDLDLDKLIDLAYDPYLPMAEALARDLVEAYDRMPRKDLAPAIELLRQWNYRTSKMSVEMTLLHYYLMSYIQRNGSRRSELGMIGFIEYICKERPDADQLATLALAVESLTADFGSWDTPWGEVNRYQRINGDRVQAFNDTLPSIPVGMASGTWGALASFGARRYPGTKRQYGTYGNSFVAVVEFGDKVTAKSLLAGGQSGDPNSPHFDDQAQLYADEQFKTVAFYRDDILKQAEAVYHPGDE
jgi:acyl-homoserine lactone acylase PvdQ